MTSTLPNPPPTQHGTITCDAHARKLLSPLNLGALDLRHRVVMRATCQAPRNAEYYAHRASSGGLILTAPVHLSALQQAGDESSAQSLGISTPSQIQFWHNVVEKVHEKGGVMVICLIAPPISPHSKSDLEILLDNFEHAAQRARAAGFDGAELHCAHGCPLDRSLNDPEFISPPSAALMLQATQTLVEIWGGDRIGVRLSPFQSANLTAPQNLARLVTTLQMLRDEEIAYLHFHRTANHDQPFTALAGFGDLRAAYGGLLLLSGGIAADQAFAAVQNRAADAIGFGMAFHLDPDFPAKLMQFAI